MSEFSARLAVAPFSDDVDQSIEPAVIILLSLCEFRETFFVLYLRVHHDCDLIVLLAQFARNPARTNNWAMRSSRSSLSSVFFMEFAR